ncbi:hypothetical protein WA538_000183 [Blastocystis sp. DL]
MQPEMGDPEHGGAGVSEDSDVNVKYSYDSSKRHNYYLNLCKITLAIGAWYLSSIMATVVNKLLISGREKVLPLTLTFAHVFISSCCDVVNLSVFHKDEMSFYLKNMNVRVTLSYLLPLSVAMVATKLLTYISYSYIPASLTHTVKALQPFFNVLIVFLWTGEGVDRRIIFSLFPIVFGVAYASVTELEFNTIGFVSALISTIVGVWQSVYVKMLMRLGLEKNYLHWTNGTLSWILLLPIVMITEYSEGSWRNINVKHLFISSIIQYMSSIASYYTMSLVTSLSYSIASTFKRVAIILTSVLYFGKTLSFSNILGICVASIGAIMYNVNTKRNPNRRKSPELKANRELSYMDLKTITI